MRCLSNSWCQALVCVVRGNCAVEIVDEVDGADMKIGVLNKENTGFHIARQLLDIRGIPFHSFPQVRQIFSALLICQV